MPSTISLTGLQSNIDPDEDRPIALVDVDYNGTIYKWQTYVPVNTVSLEQFLESSKSRIEAEIDAKEAEWAALDPKTRIIDEPFKLNQPRIVDIQKEEIVKPDIPDYYAKRRAEYPSLRAQLGAVWKGIGSADYIAISEQIEEVKNRNPKLYKTPEEITADLVESIVNESQKRLDAFARTRNYEGILSACTYATSPIQKFSAEGQYCVEVRALTWAALYQILDEVQAGIRPAPTSFADVESSLPPLVWPV